MLRQRQCQQLQLRQRGHWQSTAGLPLTRTATRRSSPPRQQLLSPRPLLLQLRCHRDGLPGRPPPRACDRAHRAPPLLASPHVRSNLRSPRKTSALPHLPLLQVSPQTQQQQLAAANAQRPYRRALCTPMTTRPSTMMVLRAVDLAARPSRPVSQRHIPLRRQHNLSRPLKDQRPPKLPHRRKRCLSRRAVPCNTSLSS
jgi:hypothetical protein